MQGYHGLAKTLQNNVYYYQDELGSTSHIASASGTLIESYQYDLYGKPQVYDASGVHQQGATPQAQDLFTGQRWRSELGLYDDRNRFMSPDLGRFLQPDPIGFKGDASNLYRYCGNDWANRTDPMGTDDTNLGVHYAEDLGAKETKNVELQGDASGKTANQTQQSKTDAPNVEPKKTDQPKAEGSNIHIDKAGNWGDQKSPDYYKEGITANGQPAEGVTDYELRNLTPHQDGSVTGTLYVDSHVRPCHKGDEVDRREQEHPNGWKEFYKGLSDNVFMKFVNKSFASPFDAAQAKANYIQNLYREEKTKQNVWDGPHGRHDLRDIPKDQLNPCP